MADKILFKITFRLYKQNSLSFRVLVTITVVAIGSNSPINFIQVYFFVDITESSPGLRHLKSKERHIFLQRFCWSITVPKFKAPLNVFKGSTPITRNVALECLSENWIEFLNVLLKSNNITI